MDQINTQDRHALFVEAAANLSAGELTQAIAAAAAVPIAENIIEEAKMRQLLPIDRFSVGPVLQYNKKKRTTAYKISRYGTPPTAIKRYTRFNVEPWIVTIHPEVSIFDVMDANFNIVTDTLEDAGKEIAVKEDREALIVFNAAAADPGGTYPTSGSDEWPTVSEGPGDVGYELSTNVARLDEGTTPVAADILQMQAYLGMIGYNADGLLMNPYTAGKLFASTEFLLALNFGARDVMERGFIENALGVKLAQSRLVGQRDIWGMDTGEGARFVERNALQVVASTEMLMNKWLLWERVCVFVPNAKALFRLMYKE